MNLYDATIPVLTKMLHNVEAWLDRAVAHAEQKKFDPELYTQLRLAPDMYSLTGQIQAMCDTAKYAAAKMTGKEAPSHPDTEKTLAELRARLATCISYLESFTREEFVGCEDRNVAHEWMRGQSMRAGDYLDHFALPNFYFHLTTAYAILRHNGVDLGKVVFLGRLPFQAA